MRIIVFGNNWVAWQSVDWLRSRGENIVGLIVHPREKCRFRDEIVEAAGVPDAAVFRGDRLREPETVRAIAGLGADVGVSLLFDYILKPELIELFPGGVINLHPAYLPHNRGQYPNVWSIVEGSPSGVTLHYVDAGVDTGDIIAQTLVPFTAVDTGESLYRRLETAALELFKNTWPAIAAGEADRRPQELEAGSYHRVQDVDRIDEIDPDATYRARDLIDILRARTFPPHRGAFFRENGRKVYLRLHLYYEHETGS